MSKILAIRGHSTRGKEVIELLEMMGGTNPFSNNGKLLGNKETCCYYIAKNAPNKYIFWNYIGPEEINNYKIFTIEEFLEKYPFKVGDKVMDHYGDSLTIKLMEWHDELEAMLYTFDESSVVLAAEDLKATNVNQAKSPKMKSVLAELLNHIKNTSKEELEREFNELEEWSNVGPTVEEFMDFCDKVNKKPKYPTNYKESCNVLGLNTMDNDACGYKADLIICFQELHIARDAYWKIAGEEMGLGKPWAPDWNDLNRKYFISLTCDGISLYDDFRNPQFLAFPTVEMRDAFYENFKNSIETCKELL